ncbi:hypothetical protein [Aestuariibacter sp. A3R04]|uniref:hypothetical protein n=1 Tax=Aestuariibacter sp. A3R04 TaxID=2841571 RepID=UPI001C0A0247|nr:hypothetical protein [Aestuariibacter sp. A3R04]MBU3020753.1 hypothetical protein [Aestuariibacter sp. A3R04]
MKSSATSGGNVVMKYYSLALVASMTFAPSICVAGSSIGEQAESWLSEKVDVSDRISVSLSKNKIKFDGCRQKDYKLSVATSLTRNINVEAIARYGRGVLEFGVFNQRVTSRAYELITWWQQPNYRMGLASQLRPAHDLDLPMSGSFSLPDSTTFSVYLETQGWRDAHTLSFALRRESWRANSSDLVLSWDRSADNQIHLGYKIGF